MRTITIKGIVFIFLLFLAKFIFAQNQGLPYVVYSFPVTNQVNVSVDTSISILFSASVDSSSVFDPESLENSNFKLLDDNNIQIPGRYFKNQDNSLFVFEPSYLLNFGANYKIEIKGARDKQGNLLNDVQIRFTTYLPKVISHFGKSIGNTVQNISGIDYHKSSKTVFLANTPGLSSDRSPEDTGLLPVDVSQPDRPRQLGAEIATAGYAKDVLILENVAMAPRPCTDCKDDLTPDTIRGDLALIVSGGGRMTTFSNLRIYDITNIKQGNPPNYIGNQLISTPQSLIPDLGPGSSTIIDPYIDPLFRFLNPGYVQQVPTPYIPTIYGPPGIPQALAVSNACNPTGPGGSCAVYVAFTGFGIISWDLSQSIPHPRFFKNGAKENYVRYRDTWPPINTIPPTLQAWKDINRRCSSHFWDVKFLNGRVLTAGNLCDGRGAGVNIIQGAPLNNQCNASQCIWPFSQDASGCCTTISNEISLPGAWRITTVENFTIPLDRNNDGVPEEVSQLDLALVGGGQQGTLSVIVCPKDITGVCQLVGTIPVGKNVYEISVDPARQLAYISNHNDAVYIFDLNRLFNLKGDFQGSLIDKNSDNIDDRVIGILHTKNTSQGTGSSGESVVDGERGLLYLTNYDAGLTVIRTEPFEVLFDPEVAIQSNIYKFKPQPDRKSVQKDIFVFEKTSQTICLNLECNIPADANLYYQIQENPFNQPGTSQQLLGSSILTSGINQLKAQLKKGNQKICLSYNNSLFSSFFGSEVFINIINEDGTIVDFLTFTIRPARVEAPDIVKISTIADRFNEKSNCPSSETFEIKLTIDARLQLKIGNNTFQTFLDNNGNSIGPFFRGPKTNLDTTYLLSIYSDMVSVLGQNNFELKSTEIPEYPSAEIKDEGIILHEIQIEAALPIGHTFIKGVDIWDGHLVHSAQDFFLPGRGLSIDFTRTYSSLGNASGGPIGAGWTHSYNIRMINQCGQMIIIGGEGTGNAFTREGNYFRPQIGYHSTLVQNSSDPAQFDFFTKSHVRYHFQLEPSFPNEIYTLRFIEEPNGNRISLLYGEDGDFTTLDVITDASGRSLILEYAVSDMFGESRINRIRGFFPGAGSLLGLMLEYEYDSFGNLIKVIRKGTNADFQDEKIERYQYSTEEGYSQWHNLTSYIDPSGNSTIFQYYKSEVELPGIAAFGKEPAEIIKSVNEPERVTTVFNYNFNNGSREVSDPRPNVTSTKYTLNTYGATTKVESPLEKVVEMEWCTDNPHPSCNNRIDVLMVSSRDALGRMIEYEYDTLGNRTKEIIRLSGSASHIRSLATGDQQQISIYQYDQKFSKLILKRDALGNETTYKVDPQTGNLLSETDAQGNSSYYRYYDDQGQEGNLKSTTDPKKNTTSYEGYDPFGNPTKIRDAKGNYTFNVYDERSRLLETFDDFTHHAKYAYDGLDRKTLEVQLDDRGAKGSAQKRSFKYSPNGKLMLETDGLGQSTEYQYDKLDRLIRKIERDIVNPHTGKKDLVATYSYDLASNLIKEVNYRGIETLHRFDELNRKFSTQIVRGPSAAGPVGLIHSFGYDLENHKLWETNIHNDSVTYIYDWLYRNVEKNLPVGGAKIVMGYDLLGNKTLETDANGNPIFFTYDKIYQVTSKTDPIGNVIRYNYDASGNIVRETYLSKGRVIRQVDNFYNDPLNRLTRKQELVFLGNPAASSTSKVSYETLYEYQDQRNATIITNPRGFKSLLRRDGLDRLYEKTLDVGGLNLTTTYSYDANGNLQSIKDPEGDQADVHHVYDGLNRKIFTQYVRTSNDAQIVKETFSYDATGNLIEYVDKRGITFRYDYDHLNRKVKERLSESISNQGDELILKTFKYYDQKDGDGLHRIVETDANGNNTEQYFDGLDRLTRLSDPYGSTIQHTFDGVNRTSSRDKKGHYTAFTYDNNNRVVLVQEFDQAPDNGGKLITSIVTEYKDDFLQILTTDRKGVQHLQQKDSRGRLIHSSTQHVSLLAEYGQQEITLEKYAYDGLDNKTLYQDAEGNLTQYTYDGADRMILMEEGAGSLDAASTSYHYDKAGNLLYTKDGRDHGLTNSPYCPYSNNFDVCYTYDDRYRKVTETNGEGETTLYRYDNNDNLIQLTEPSGNKYTTTFRYDELNSLILVDEGSRVDNLTAAGLTFYVYDANRNRIAQQDANGNLVTYKYDLLNRLTDTYQHLSPGKITATTNRPNPNQNFYSSFGGDQNPSLHWHYGYDLNDNQNLVIDAKGQSLSFSFDYLNRLTLKIFSQHTFPSLDYQPQSITYQYDANSNPIAIQEVKNRGGAQITETKTYTYDALDRLASSTNYDNKSIKYTYDLQGNRASLTDPDGITNKFEYDSRNRLNSIVLNGKDTSRYQYHPDNLLKKIIYPNGTVIERSMDGAYDRADRQKIILNKNRTFGDTISMYVYQYDANGNRSSQLELQKVFNRGLPETTLYKYDQLNRLIAVEYGKNGISGKVSYTYSKNGNRLSEAGQDPTNQLKPINRLYNYDYANRLRSITNKLDSQQSTYFNYDNNGNRTSKTIGNIETKIDNSGRPVIRIITAKDSTTYKYGIRDELLQSATSKNELTSFDYDYNQMRVKKTSKLEIKHYLYDFENSLLEYGQNGITQIKYNYGNNLLSLVQTSNGVKDQQFYLFDGLGSISNLTDSTSQNKYSYQYDAWGGKRNSQGSSSNTKNYTGHYYDEDVNLHYFGARYYEDDFGTFISQDPYFGELQTPLSLNRYLYAYANPLRYIDLTGYQNKEVTPHREIKTIDLEGETFYYRKGENGEIEITNTGFGLTENDVVIKESRSNLGESVKFSKLSDEHPTLYDLGKSEKESGINWEQYVKENLAKYNLDLAPTKAVNKLEYLLPGTEAGESAAMYWADLYVEGENQGGFGGFLKQAVGGVFGSFASLWTPNTAVETAITLGTAGFGAAAQAGRLGALSTPVLNTFKVTGSFQAGLSGGQAITGTSLSGEDLSGGERLLHGGAALMSGLALRGGPGSSLFGRSNLRPPGMGPGVLNKGAVRIGWSWRSHNLPGGGSNYFALHGGGTFQGINQGPHWHLHLNRFWPSGPAPAPGWATATVRGGQMIGTVFSGAYGLQVDKQYFGN